MRSYLALWCYLLTPCIYLTNLKKSPQPSPVPSLHPSPPFPNCMFPCVTTLLENRKRTDSWVEQQIWPTEHNHKTFPDSGRGKCRLVSLGTEESILKLKFTFGPGQAGCLLVWSPNLSKQGSACSGSYSDRWLPGHQRDTVLLLLIQKVGRMRKCGRWDNAASPLGQNHQASDFERQF